MLPLPHAFHCPTLGVGDRRLYPLHRGRSVFDVRDRQPRRTNESYGQIPQGQESGSATLPHGIERHVRRATRALADITAISHAKRSLAEIADSYDALASFKENTKYARLARPR
jgi:hypothetical protein